MTTFLLPSDEYCASLPSHARRGVGVKARRLRLSHDLMFTVYLTSYANPSVLETLSCPSIESCQASLSRNGIIFPSITEPSIPAV